MKVAGIIAEYNPFHNGHKFHIEETKKQLSATHTVAVMSGNFVMRGEPALKDKKTRAEAAVSGGCDLVIELPVCYSLSSAEYFSYGGVYLLNALGVVDYLSFGSESGELKELYNVAEKLRNPGTVELLKAEMKSGIPVFKALSNLFPEYSDITDKPNNILGINYIKAIMKLESNIKPFTLKRKGADYNSDEVFGEIASATAIRNRVYENKDISLFLPRESAEIIGNDFIKEENFDSLVTYALRMANKEKLKKYADVGEGLENLISKAAFENYGIKNIADGIKSKRYAYTRIKRIIYNILLDIPKEAREKNPEYIKVLAFNEKGREILRKAKDNASLPIITNLTKKDFCNFEGVRREYLAEAVYKCRNKE